MSKVSKPIKKVTKNSASRSALHVPSALLRAPQPDAPWTGRTSVQPVVVIQPKSKQAHLVTDRKLAGQASIFRAIQITKAKGLRSWWAIQRSDVTWLCTIRGVEEFIPIGDRRAEYRRAFRSCEAAESYIKILERSSLRTKFETKPSSQEVFNTDLLGSNKDLRNEIESFPFKILPPGISSVEAYQKHIRSSYGTRAAQVRLDWSRLYTLQREVGAQLIALGKDSWRGYAVFGFSCTKRILLDSIVSGNAAYILEGRWREMIHINKAEIREEYRAQHKRVFHSGVWHQRLKAVLYARW